MYVVTNTTIFLIYIF